MDLKTVARDMRLASLRAVELRKAGMAGAAGKLNALSPLATLARGYSIARDDDGTTLSSIEDFTGEREFDLILRDGTVRANPSATRSDPILPGFCVIPQRHFGGTP